MPWPGTAGGCSLTQCQNLRRHVLRQAVLKARTFGMQHLAHARNLRRRRRRRSSIVARDQHMDVATALQRGGDGVEGCALDGCVVVFGNYEGGESGHFLFQKISIS